MEDDCYIYVVCELDRYRSLAKSFVIHKNKQRNDYDDDDYDKDPFHVTDVRLVDGLVVADAMTMSRTRTTKTTNHHPQHSHHPHEEQPRVF